MGLVHFPGAQQTRQRIDARPQGTPLFWYRAATGSEYQFPDWQWHRGLSVRAYLWNRWKARYDVVLDQAAKREFVRHSIATRVATSRLSIAVDTETSGNNNTYMFVSYHWRFWQ